MFGTWGWVGTIIAGIVVGWLIGAYTLPNRNYPGGMWGYVITGVIGGIGGAFIPGNWGWTLGAANMIAAIVVAALLTYVVGLFGEAKIK